MLLISPVTQWQGPDMQTWTRLYKLVQACIDMKRACTDLFKPVQRWGKPVQTCSKSVQICPSQCFLVLRASLQHIKQVFGKSNSYEGPGFLHAPKRCDVFLFFFSPCNQVPCICWSTGMCVYRANKKLGLLLYSSKHSCTPLRLS